MITLIIADDNVHYNLSLSSFLTKEKDIKIIDICVDGKSALLSYLKNKPTAMILDLDMPILNGLQVLESLNSHDFEKKTYNNIIVISGNTKLRTKLSSLENVHHVFNKPCEHNEILAKIREIEKNSACMDSLKLSILAFMQKLNFNMNSIGTIYLSEILFLNYSSSKRIQLKTLISNVAQQNNVTYLAVKSAIYHSVDTMNRFVNLKALDSLVSSYFNGKKITVNDILYLFQISLH